MQVAVESLIEALRRHAAVMIDEDASAETVLPAIHDVRAAAVRYVDAVFDATGWGNVFADLHDDDLDLTEAPETTSETPMTLSVRARYDYVVPDIEALLQAGQRARAQEWADDPHSATPVAHAGEAIYELLHATGAPLASLTIPELEPGSGLVTVHRTTQPLTPEEFESLDIIDDLKDVLLPDEEDELLYVLTEPRYETREEAEEAARRHSTHEN